MSQLLTSFEKNDMAETMEIENGTFTALDLSNDWDLGHEP